MTFHCFLFFFTTFGCLIPASYLDLLTSLSEHANHVGLLKMIDLLVEYFLLGVL